MARWEPNARERLAASALDLFVERGYEGTTAAEIATRAGLAKSTFFRHFTDKREVLFSGGELLSDAFVTAIEKCPPGTTPLGVLHAALEAASFPFNPDRRDWVVKRQTVIAANTELLERELLKQAAITEAMTTALQKRGLDPRVAAVTAELGNLAFRAAFTRWTAPTNTRDFADLAHEELTASAKAATTLT
ncbi:TetR/AcrR family transcriptional regulator [Paractinoplanes atraurantiacus]|uniref:DNA-binding transcriptional regulator, AcrR family n=1 Tax=Paractinoplanes atraurantiacus TaxID=1036182 RepID=A0A285ID21_9ACTN|nr:TetR/AcrR family transcriptional regulator [Actinoplanes atraurantiacus]SNY45862.1 DNA-binding transcriptional regulator, AcrR family [Actinoplanes atraurantiacus]